MSISRCTATVLFSILPAAAIPVGPGRTAEAQKHRGISPSDRITPGAADVSQMVNPLADDKRIRPVWVGPSQGGAAGGGQPETLVYSNVWGRSVFGPEGSAALTRVADDVVTIGAAGCSLSRYVFRVTGDRQRDGSGADQPYTVRFAFHEACPGAGGGVIPGTAGEVTVPAADAGAITEITFVPSTDVPLPQTMFLSLRFDRENCGTVVGAPAAVGFSADRIDFPGSACNAAFGGYPDRPHASFYLQVYVDGECPVVSPGYRNTNHAGRKVNPGVGIHFADDLRMDAFGLGECRLTAYEVAHRGFGILDVSIHQRLSDLDPVGGFQIAGSRAFCWSSGDDVQICRHELPEPVVINRQPLFVRFAASTIDVGVVQTCRTADLGESADVAFVYQNGEWRDFVDEACRPAFDVTLYCEDLPTVGACCDMHVTDPNGEAVCRDLVPKRNCPSADLWTDIRTLWVADAHCGPVCDGGPQDGQPCAVDDCPSGTCESGVCSGGINRGRDCQIDDCPEGSCDGPFCDGGINDGLPCTRAADCPGGDCVGGPFALGAACGLAGCCKPAGATGPACENLTENECRAVRPVDGRRHFEPGSFCQSFNFSCPLFSCGEGGDCCAPSADVCLGGVNYRQPCDPVMAASDCPGYCIGGANDGAVCASDARCDGGFCDFPGCGMAPGCDDAECCARVCAEGGGSDPWNDYRYCCEVEWDVACARRAAELCECGGVYGPPPFNDRCFSDVPNEGALMIDAPTIVTINGVSATSEGDPGFCCKGGDEGGPGVGGVWYKFVAPDKSVRLSTCCTQGRQIGDEFFPAEDGLIQVFEVADPNRGICTDGLTACDLAAPDPDAPCPEGETCEFDEAFACDHLVPIACNDDAEDGCPCGANEHPGRSKLCATGLTPGDLYYVLVAGKTEADRGFYSLAVTSPCPGDPPHPNDFCADASVPAGQADPAAYPLVEPFDLSGDTLNPPKAPATFDCPGPACSGPASSMINDIWYDWTPPSDGHAIVETCGGSDETTPDTGLVVYEGCECPVDPANEIACNDFRNSPCFLGARVDFPVEAGQCYKIRLGGHHGGTPAGTLTIDLTHIDQCSGPVEFLDPPSGVVDARQPTEPGGGPALGIRSLRIRGDRSAMPLRCWDVCENPPPAGGVPPNAVESITQVSVDEFVVNLARPLTPGAVTVVHYRKNFGADLPVMARLSAHPGNSNADGFVDVRDVASLIDFVEGKATPPWGRYSADIDHSGRIAPADVLRLIDLLSGADTFDPWLDTPLPECGDCCPGP